MRWLLLVALTACSNAWDSGSTVFCNGPAAFCVEATQAIDAWTAALSPCAFPFVVGATGEHVIQLVSADAWDCDEKYAACENHVRINVKGPAETGHRLEIEHELGHAFGLEHSPHPGTLMYFREGAEIKAEDVSRARDALGCA